MQKSQLGLYKFLVRVNVNQRILRHLGRKAVVEWHTTSYAWEVTPALQHEFLLYFSGASLLARAPKPDYTTYSHAFTMNSLHDQVNYLDENDVNAFEIYVNDSPYLMCTTMTHTPQLSTKAWPTLPPHQNEILWNSTLPLRVFCWKICEKYVYSGMRRYVFML